MRTLHQAIDDWSCVQQKDWFDSEQQSCHDDSFNSRAWWQKVAAKEYIAETINLRQIQNIESIGTPRVTPPLQTIPLSIACHWNLPTPEAGLPPMPVNIFKITSLRSQSTLLVKSSRSCIGHIVIFLFTTRPFVFCTSCLPFCSLK